METGLFSDPVRKPLPLILTRSGSTPKVNILAHFMGGLLVREAVQCTYPQAGRKAGDFINKIVTLGTPHKGISFQFFENWMRIDAADEAKHFHPDFQENATNCRRKIALESLLASPRRSASSICCSTSPATSIGT